MTALATLLAALVAALPFAASASLPDIEDEVMCVVCGTTLEKSNAPSAQQERDFIREQIAAGRTKEQIKDALVAEYGREVLAVPDGSGVDLVPILGVLLGLAAVGTMLWHGRRGARALETPAGAAEPPDLDPQDAARLDAELAAHDG